MVNANGVTVLDSVQQLEESGPGEKVVADKVAAVGNVCEEVAFRAVLEDNKGSVGVVHDV